MQAIRSYISTHTPSGEEIKQFASKAWDGAKALLKKVAAFAISCFNKIIAFFENRTTPPPAPLPSDNSLPLDIQLSKRTSKITAEYLETLTQEQKELDASLKPELKEVLFGVSGYPDLAKITAPKVMKEGTPDEQRLYGGDAETEAMLSKNLLRAWTAGNKDVPQDEEGKKNHLKELRKLIVQTKQLIDIDDDARTNLFSASTVSYTIPYYCDLYTLDNQKSREQEDFYAAGKIQLPNGTQGYYFGVMDGSGVDGSQCSQFVADNVGRVLEENLAKYNPVLSLTLTGVANALKMTGVDLEAEYRQSNRENNSSTMSLVVIIDSYVWFSNIGDSRAILSLKDETIQVTEDAKPSVEHFQQAVLRRGNTIQGNRVFSNDADPNEEDSTYTLMTRVILANDDFKLTARSKLTCIPMSAIPAESKLVIASDGLWDVFPSTQVGMAVQKGWTAQELAAAARSRDSKDDITVLIVDLKPTVTV